MAWSLTSTKTPGRGSQLDFSDGGFWLGTSQRVDARGGTIELRCVDKTTIEMKNTRGKFKWIDRIDSNANKNDPWWFRSLETLNEGAEWITGADFPVEIDWKDNRPEVRSSSSQ